MHSQYLREFDESDQIAEGNNVTRNDLVLNPYWYHEKQSTGTTIIAFEFDGGVMLAADTRTSSGSYVANRYADKLDPLTDRIIACRSGSAADTQAILNIVRYHLNFYEMEIGERPTVKVAANIIRQLIYDYRDQLSAAIICAGWDKKNGGQVYMINLGGMLSRHKIAINGSGSGYIYGYLDSNFKFGLSQEEARQLAINAISLAIVRDGHSGGCCRLAVINEHGVQRENIESDNLPFSDLK